MLGRSASTRLRNVGEPLDPSGEAQTRFAVWLANEAVSVPVVVTGLPLTEKMAGSDSATKVTVPDPAAGKECHPFAPPESVP